MAGYFFSQSFENIKTKCCRICNSFKKLKELKLNFHTYLSILKLIQALPCTLSVTPHQQKHQDHVD